MNKFQQKNLTSTLVILLGFCSWLTDHGISAQQKALYVGSHIIVKVSIVILIALLTFDNNLVGQSRVLQGRVISNYLETLAGVRIQNVDTLILGETNLDGRFKIELPQK